MLVLRWTHAVSEVDQSASLGKQTGAALSNLPSGKGREGQATVRQKGAERTGQESRNAPWGVPFLTALETAVTKPSR